MSNTDKRQSPPDGYAVLLDDKAGAPNGFWFVNTYHDQGIAADVAQKQKGARVVPIFFDQSANTVLMAKVEEFRALSKNWDSYGAGAFDPRTIDLAKEVASRLGPEWKCVPCADGPSVWLYRGDEEDIIEVRTGQ